jgi:Protein of unknown function (DUF1573)
MKNTIILGFVAALVGACTSQENVNAEERKIEYAKFLDNPTEIAFDEMTHDFGSVKDGEEVTHIFKFKNTGETELILIDVKAKCGCTVPQTWPTQPIAPGGTGEITIVFDSSGKVGNVRKTVTVEANTNPTTSVLTLAGVVTE